MSGAETRHVSPLDAYIADMPGGPFYRRSEVAALLGVTTNALGAVRDDDERPEMSPVKAIRYRGRVLYLYSEDGLTALRKHFRRPNAGAGRPRLWSLQEGRERRKQIDLARYYTSRAQKLRGLGDDKRAAAAEIKAARLRKKLDEQLAKRQATRVAP